MLQLITATGKLSRALYLKAHKIPDFKSALRSITSSRILVVSTKFRTDICYSSHDNKDNEVIKLWTWYTDTALADADQHEFIKVKGNEAVLSYYFNSMNQLFANWFHSRRYRKAFQQSYIIDQNNPLLNTIIMCDEFLIKERLTQRAPLLNRKQKIDPPIDQDTLDLAVKLFNNSSRSN